MSIQRRLLPALAIALTIAAGSAQAQYSIAIDPGHGGSDPGAAHCGLEEADVNLAMSLKLKALLQADPDLTPLLTRETDQTVSLAGRVDIANDAGVTRFASVHANAYDGTVTGIETYCYTSGSDASFDQRDEIQAAMLAAWPLKDRGGKTQSFYVIKYTSMPATLSEMAFLDNCAIDALYLGSDAHLQEAAEAHHDALRESLGLGDTPVGPAPGTLQGVVFEDQGVGLDDTSIRLPGATVTVEADTGSVGATTTAASPSGGWAFDLAPGDWTVTATLAGYDTASRTCSLGAGGETWCSVGLMPKTVSTADPGPSVQDAGSAPDTSGIQDAGVSWPDVWSPPDAGGQPDAGQPFDAGGGTAEVWWTETWTPPPDAGTTADAGTPSPDTGLSPPDAASPQDEVDGASAGTDFGGAGADAASADTGGFAVPGGDDPSNGRNPAIPPASGDGGCSAAGAPGGGAWALGLLLLLGLRRRRATALFTALLLVACSTPRAPDPSPAPAPEPTVRERTAAVLAADSVVLESLVRLPGSEGLTSPLLSPDSQRVLATTPDLGRLVVLPAAGGEPATLVEAPRCGWAPRWLDDATVAYRTPNQPMHAVPLLSARVDGAPAGPPSNPTPGRWVRVIDGGVHLRLGDRQQRISEPGDRYCCARLDAGGRLALFQGAATGAWAYEVDTGRLVALGPGHHPRASSDGRRVVLAHPIDDGHEVVESLLVLVDLAQNPPVARRLGAPPLARAPSFTPDDEQLLFEADGALWTTAVP